MSEERQKEGQMTDSYIAELSDDELKQMVDRIRRGDSAYPARYRVKLLDEAERRNL